MSIRLLPNQPFKLVISVEGVNPTADGFATFSWFGKRANLYECVDLKTYPSMRDFSGSSYAFEIGTVGTVVKFIGRPAKIKKDPKWCKFDLYEVFIDGKIVQMFRQNMEPICYHI
tara:strand:+ start:1670 stop:2014 length:345 start_codon:yes stop_codon:yes gene_type:complete